MTIRGLTQEMFERRLSAVVRPSRPIDSFECLVDRAGELDRIEQAIASPGRHVFIYGERGAGKTSLAQTAAFKYESAYTAPAFCACGRQTTFSSIVQDAAEQLMNRSKASSKEFTRGVGIGAGIFSAKASVKESPRELPDRIDLNLATALLQEASSKRPGRSVVVIDEFENLAPMEERQLFAELVKQLSDRDVQVALVFCGVGKSIADLLEGHESAHRYLEGIRLPTPPLTFDGREALVHMAGRSLGLHIAADVALRVSRVSDGFPHYIHLLCQKMFWLAYRAESDVEVIGTSLYRAAVAEAVESVEAHLRGEYDKAVMKDHDDYREVLWALADNHEAECNVRRVYGESYVRIMLTRNRIPMEFEQFQACLSNLRSARHGSILISERRSWIRFRVSMMRGYVRLKAEASGVALAI
jgi:uncharacterized protein